MYNLVGGSIVILLGILLLIGNKLKYKFINNPPPEWWLFYSQSFIKKFFGHKFLVYYTYFLAICLILGGIFIIFS